MQNTKGIKKGKEGKTIGLFETFVIKKFRIYFE